MQIAKHFGQNNENKGFGYKSIDDVILRCDSYACHF